MGVTHSNPQPGFGLIFLLTAVQCFLRSSTSAEIHLFWVTRGNANPQSLLLSASGSSKAPGWELPQAGTLHGHPGADPCQTDGQGVNLRFDALLSKGSGWDALKRLMVGVVPALTGSFEHFSWLSPLSSLCPLHTLLFVTMLLTVSVQLLWNCS